jgi:L-seryl-tRNA(Ser) seleniumtransferase
MDAANPRALPALHRLLATPQAEALLREHPRAVVVAALRSELEALRMARRAFAEAPFFAAVATRLREAARPGLRRVINATGVVLHTNLGRASLPAAALAAITAEAGGACNLEISLESGARGDRHAACAALLTELTGAEAALVVNNGAAAMLLALTALAAGGEAVVSRGELVEIGGGFRIPDVIRQGGARLVEVGTTNRTRIADYAAAIGAETRILLRVHPSNYRITGFTGAPAPAEIAALARARGLLAVEDLGSGALYDLSRIGLLREPTLADSVAAGFDLVAASADKLLGGPQAGLLVGRREVMARLAAHPLMRALRPGKLVLAALEAVLRLYRDPAGVVQAVPVLAMLAESAGAVGERAERLRAMLPDAAGAEVIDGQSLVGGGALPEARIPTRLLALGATPPERVAVRLRQGDPPVVARIAEGRLLLDLRTVPQGELPALAAALHAAVMP